MEAVKWIVCAGALVGVVGSTWAGTPGMPGPSGRPASADEDAVLPRVALTRLLEHGASESLSLRCTVDRTGKQEFFCEARRFRNGVEVATTSLYAKQTKSILAGFMQLVPPAERKAVAAVPPPRERSSKEDPLLVWDVAFEGKKIEGTLLRHDARRKNPVVDAILSLEGALDSQFYR